VLLTRSATKMKAQYGCHLRVSARKILYGGQNLMLVFGDK